MLAILTALRRTVVLARSGCAGTGTAGLLDAQRPALVDLALQTLLGSVSLLRGDHLDETEAARLLRVRVAHDVALLDFTILLEETCDLVLGQRWMNAGDEEVGALITALISFTVARLRWGATATRVSKRCLQCSADDYIPAVTVVGGSAAGAGVVVVAAITAR